MRRRRGEEKSVTNHDDFESRHRRQRQRTKQGLFNNFSAVFIVDIKKLVVVCPLLLLLPSRRTNLIFIVFSFTFYYERDLSVRGMSRASQFHSNRLRRPMVNRSTLLFRHTILNREAREEVTHALRIVRNFLSFFDLFTS